MRIFLTGSTGYIGSAVLDALQRANHQVVALVRTPQAAEALTARGVTPVLGDLKVAKSYRTAADGFDGYVHTAAESSPKRDEVDCRALETLLAAAAAHARTSATVFVYTSGLWLLGSDATLLTESAQPNPGPLLGWRVSHEQVVLQSSDGNLRTAVVRPGVVYGGSRGIISDLLKNALNGLIRVIGTGENHWPLVYDRDLADLYVRILAHQDASGIFHANDEADETVNAIVEGVVRYFSVQPGVRHVPLDEARKKMGPYADALAIDQRVRSARARSIGWAPTLHSVSANVPRLLEEFRSGQDRAA
jgi:nucleoside-diphosphate-sugar epimerase